MLFYKALALPAAMMLVSATPLPPNSTLYSDGTPPDRFQGNGAATVMFVSQDDIDDYCGKAPKGMQTLACTNMETKVPIMAMPNPCTFQYDYYAHLACHELGHVNHWPATHGD